MRVFSGFWGFLGNIWISYVCTSFGNICGNGEKVAFLVVFVRICVDDDEHDDVVACVVCSDCI